MPVATEAGSELTEHEGMLLALIVRQEPVRPYQLYKLFEESPVTSINSSKGQLYPAIRRLKAKGLLKARLLKDQRRKVEELTITTKGRAAAARWTERISDRHIMLDDPLRTRVLSFDLLTRDKKIRWITKAKALVKARRQQIDEYNDSVSVPYQRFAYHGTLEMLRIKMEWLDDLLQEVVNENAARVGSD